MPEMTAPTIVGDISVTVRDRAPFGLDVRSGSDGRNRVIVPEEDRIALAAAILGDDPFPPAPEVADLPDNEIGGMRRRQFLDALGAVAINSDLATYCSNKTCATEEEQDEYEAKATTYFARRNDLIRDLMAFWDRIAAEGDATLSPDAGDVIVARYAELVALAEDLTRGWWTTPLTSHVTVYAEKFHALKDWIRANRLAAFDAFPVGGHPTGVPESGEGADGGVGEGGT